jgi:heptaprenyl diphosphate synthase
VNDRTWIRDAVVRHQLERVDALLREAARGEHPASRLHDQLTSTKAKRLRPAALLLAARLGPRRSDRLLIRAATGLELLHEATLYHDDIVDEARVRRGETATHHAVGTPAAALAGSELLFRTAEFFADLSAADRRSIGRAVDALCRGQLREIELIDDPDVSPRTRIRVMRDKGASLFAIACRLGASAASAARPIVRRMTAFGQRLGLAFQLADDLEDIFASAGALGRRPGSDLRDGVCTLPVLFAAAGRSPQQTALRQALARVAGHAGPDEALVRCIELVRRGGGVEASLELLGEWLGAARRSLEEIAVAGADDALASLSALLDHISWHATTCTADESPCTTPAASGDA